MVRAFARIIAISRLMKLTLTNGLVLILRADYPKENCKSSDQNTHAQNCYIGLRGNPRRLGEDFSNPSGSLTDGVAAQI